MIFVSQYTTVEEDNMAKVSIIVPVYNPKEEYLIQCLDSICSQSLQDIEIILVDNASTGNNPQILQSYKNKDHRIKLLQFKENIGFSGACNQALKEVSAEYIQIVDSDDFITHDCTQTLYNTMQQYPDCDLLLFCAYEYHTDTSQNLTTPKYDYTSVSGHTHNQAFKFSDIPEQLLGSSSQAWNKFYKTTLIKDNNNYFDEDFTSFGSDTIFSYYNYINAREIRLIPDRLYHYRYNVSDGVMNKISQKDCPHFLAPITLVKKIDNIVHTYPQYYQKFKVLNVLILQIFFNKIHKSNQKEYFYTLKKYFQQNQYAKEILNLAQARKWYKQILNHNYLSYKIRQILNWRTKHEKQ